MRPCMALLLFTREEAAGQARERTQQPSPPHLCLHWGAFCLEPQLWLTSWAQGNTHPIGEVKITFKTPRGGQARPGLASPSPLTSVLEFSGGHMTSDQMQKQVQEPSCLPLSHMFKGFTKCKIMSLSLNFLIGKIEFLFS